MASLNNIQPMLGTRAEDHHIHTPYPHDPILEPMGYFAEGLTEYVLLRHVETRAYYAREKDGAPLSMHRVFFINIITGMRYATPHPYA